MKGQITIRPITSSDNKAIARIIRTSLEEYGVARPGTVYTDESTDHLSDIFTHPRSIYYIIDLDGTIVGGAGIYPTEGLDGDTCELVKMYLTAEARGKGLGRALMDQCIRFAADQGYKQIYLETMPELKQAIDLYQRTGFQLLSAPIGSSGHFGCGIWMIKKIQG